MRRSKSIETLLPILYLKGISTGDFSESAGGAAWQGCCRIVGIAVGRLKDGWLDEHTAWQRCAICRRKSYVYIWADGIHLQARLEDEKQCILVLMRRDAGSRKELVGFTDGAREKRAGLARSAPRPEAPRARRGRRGSSSRWRTRVLEWPLAEVWPKTRRAALLGAQDRERARQVAEEPAAERPKRALQEIWMAETRVAAELAFDAFIESYTPKYEKAAIA